ncbi:hyaluronoglucosaminidase [Ralstonia phage RSP15]|uniref:virion structural protein n=1 Tax=Ralstonia phage RSP15 TaxID=1785960 RepID=UPI00074D30A0|nr:virion structural protein [Ralstonia phage RSP15]BAU40200.1 hyaluronoglucosaminidase [Ralstonia phage RSP15]
MATDIFQFQGTIKLRRGLAAEWTSYNPILAEGEFGVELDTSTFKIGNGVLHWVDLPYAGSPGPAGPAGADGTNGRDGTDGTNGVDGAKGDKGDTGTFTADVMASLPSADSLGLADQFPVLQGPTAKKATIQNLKDRVTSSDNVWTGDNKFQSAPILGMIDLYTTPQSGTVNVNWSQGGFTRLRFGGNSAVSFLGPFVANEVYEMIFEVSATGTGYVIAWPANTKWPNGTVVSLTPGGVDYIRFITIDGGLTFQAFVMGKDMKGA